MVVGCPLSRYDTSNLGPVAWTMFHHRGGSLIRPKRQEDVLRSGKRDQRK